MPYEIRLADATDLAAYDRLLAAAFSEGGLRPYMYPHGQSNATKVHNFVKAFKILSKPPSSGSIVMCAYDTSILAPDHDFEYPQGFEVPPQCVVSAEERPERRKVVGFAWYKLEPKPKTLEEIEKDNEPEPAPPGANAALLAAFYEALKQARLKHLPNLAHVNLNILGTAPEVWGKGVGTLLLNWGLETADKMGLPLWLEATMAGRPLYLKYGFEELGLIDFDSRKFGTPKKLTYWCMLRPITGEKADDKAGAEGMGEGIEQKGIVEAIAPTKVAGA